MNDFEQKAATMQGKLTPSAETVLTGEDQPASPAAPAPADGVIRQWFAVKDSESYSSVHVKQFAAGITHNLILASNLSHDIAKEIACDHNFHTTTEAQRSLLERETIQQRQEIAELRATLASEHSAHMECHAKVKSAYRDLANFRSAELPEEPTLEECFAAGKGPEQTNTFREGGLPNTQEERARFEAYMRGHCWCFGEYDNKKQCYDTTTVRMLYGVWRDRGLLSDALRTYAARSTVERDQAQAAADAYSKGVYSQTMLNAADAIAENRSLKLELAAARASLEAVAAEAIERAYLAVQFVKNKYTRGEEGKAFRVVMECEQAVRSLSPAAIVSAATKGTP